ncbi:lipopolysaccharide transport periplasmic protein LptA [Phaeovulum sp.]|uniref:lipopolysaccharide transport periplasmic protein LptA n=1 Tax=Phaeovulum sp. TaxID=2934796 RepID=UPI0039E4605E
MPALIRPLMFAVALIVVPLGAAAQQINFGGIRADTTAPVEVTADSLGVNQADGSATFTGNVVVGQGEMRLSAATVRIEYGADGQSRIERLFASGGVTLVNATEAAEAREAVYTIASGQIVLTGDVLLTQGQNVMSGEKLTVDLKTGTGAMDGRVRTILQPGGK